MASWVAPVEAEMTQFTFSESMAVHHLPPTRSEPVRARHCALRQRFLTPLLVLLVVCVAFVGQAGDVAAASKPSPPPVVQALPENLPKAKNSEARLQPNTVHLLRQVEYLFPYYSSAGEIGGYRQDPIMDHPSGQALDIMMENDGRDPASVHAGHKIAAFLMANSDQLGVTYMVWRQNIWYPGRDWREMSDRGNWTDNHMNHIHVLVNGSFTATDDLVLPKDLKVKLDEMPNGEELRKQAELRVAIIQKLDDAASRVASADAVNRRLTDRNTKRAKELEAARLRVATAVRSSYIQGMDTELLNSSLLLMSGPSTDPAVALALERVIRSQDDGLNTALEALNLAARELAENERELATARSELAAAEAELAALDAR